MNDTGLHVVAALDNSPVASLVAGTAILVADLLGAVPTAVHVREDGTRTARAAADAAGLPLEERDGDVIQSLLDAAGSTSIVVLGSRDRAQAGEPVGHVARDLMLRAKSPIVLVPPRTELHNAPFTALVPLDGSADSGPTLEQTFALLGSEPTSRLTALYVFDDARLPAFSDQAHHEAHAWATEFVERHCAGCGPVNLELRAGNPADQVLAVATEQPAAIIVVGWRQHLEPGRALTLRALLDRSTDPLLLLPLDH